MTKYLICEHCVFRFNTTTDIKMYLCTFGGVCLAVMVQLCTSAQDTVYFEQLVQKTQTNDKGHMDNCGMFYSL